MRLRGLFCTLLTVIFFIPTSKSQVYLLNEDFSSSNVTTPPKGWTQVQFKGAATDYWHFDNPGGRKTTYPIVGKFGIFDSETTSGGGGKESVALESPFVDCSFGTKILLYFDHQFVGGRNGKAILEVYNGKDWFVYKTFTASTAGIVSEQFDISDLAGGVTNSKFRFLWEGDSSAYWLVDNVKLFAPSLRDAALKSIDQPVSPFSGGVHPVKVTLMNEGIQPLSSVTIKWTVNGVAQPSFNWTGLLDLGMEQTNLQIGTFNFTPGAFKNIVAWVEKPNGGTDLNKLNDTAKKRIAASLCGVYTIGGANPDFSDFTEATQTLNSIGVSCPVVFKVRDTVFEEQIKVYEVPGGSSVNTVTFESERGDSTQSGFRYKNADLTNDYTLGLFGAKYVYFKSLMIQRENGKNSVLIQDGTHHIAIQNCWMKGVNSPAASVDSFLRFSYNNMEGFDFNLLQPEGKSAKGIVVEGNFFNNLFLNNSNDVIIRYNRSSAAPSSISLNYTIDRSTKVMVYSNRLTFMTCSTDSDITIRKNFLRQGCTNAMNILSGSYQVVIDSNEIQSMYVGIFCQSNRNVLIQNNDISHPVGCGVRYGMYVDGGDSVTIKRNRLDGNGFSAQGTGLTLYNVIQALTVDSNWIGHYLQNGIISQPVPGSNWKITHNTITDIGEQGIYMAGFGGLYESNRLVHLASGTGMVVNANHALLINNIVQINGNNLAKGISLMENGSGTEIYNNTFWTKGSDRNNSRAMEFLGGKDYVLRNNIFSNTGNGYAVYLQGDTSGIDLDYNNYYSWLRKIVGFKDKVFDTIYNYSLVSGKEIHARSVNPSFVSDSDFKPHHAGVIGTGIALPRVTIDIDSVLRKDPPTMGAVEASLCSDDASINELPSFLTPLKQGNLSIKAVLENNGVAPLKSVTVNWQVNGVVQTPYNWTGNLATRQSLTITVGTYNFQNGTVYQVKFWTSRPNGNQDCNTGNDSVGVGGLRTPLCGVYTIGGFNPNFKDFSEAVDVLNSVGVSCPVVFKVRDSIFYQQVRLAQIPGSSAINTVTFESESSDSSKAGLFYDPYTITNDHALKISGASYVKFKKLMILRGVWYNTSLVIDEGAHHISFENCQIGNVYSPPATVDSQLTFKFNNLQGYSINLQQPESNRANGINLEGNFVYYINISNSNNVILKDNRNADTSAVSVDYYIEKSRNITVTGNRFRTLYLPSDSGIVVRKNIVKSYDEGRYAINLSSDTSAIIDSNDVTACHIGIYEGSSRKISILNNRVSHFTGCQERYGIYIDNGDSIRVSRNRLDGVGFDKPGTGISLNNVQKKLEVDSNLVLNYQSNGIYSKGIADARWIIHHNEIQNIRDKGINIEGTGALYAGNRILLNGGAGIHVNGDHARIANNYVQVAGVGKAKGISLQSAGAFSEIIYNSVLVKGSDKFNSRALEISGGENYFIKNNIFANTGNGFAGYFETSIKTQQQDYNDYYSPHRRIIFYAGAEYDSLPLFSTLNGKEQHSPSVNPYFTSETNIKPNHALVIGTGIKYDSILVDMFEKPRPTFPTMGAVESSICNDDAGVDELIGIKSPLTSGSKPIRLMLQNHGSNVLKSATIKWEVNGIAQPSYNWSGNLSSRGRLMITIGNYNFGTASKYVMKFWTISPNGKADCNNKNDSLLVDDLRGPLCGNYTIGGLNPDFANFTEAADDLNNSGVGCKVVFKVRDGVYDEQIKLNEIKGVTAVKNITFEGESIDSSKATLSSTVQDGANDFSMFLSGTDYITFRNLGIRKRNGTVSLQIQGGAHHVSVENCWLTGIYSAPISVDSAIKITNNNITGGEIKLLQPDSIRARNISIQNNLVNAISLTNTNAVVVSGNKPDYNPDNFGKEYLFDKLTDLNLDNNRMRYLEIRQSKNVIANSNQIHFVETNWGDYTGVLLQTNENLQFLKNKIETFVWNDYIAHSKSIAIRNSINTVASGNTIFSDITNPWTYGTSIGILVTDGSKRTTVSNNNVQVGSNNGDRYAIYVDQTDSVRVKSNTVYATNFLMPSYGIYLNNIPGQLLVDSNNIANLQTTGILSKAVAGSNWKVIGNRLTNIQRQAIQVDGNGGVYDSNKMLEMKEGIGVVINAVNPLVSNNYIQIGGKGIAKGIVVNATSVNASVVFNSINITSIDPVAGRGFEVNGGDNLTVKNNVFSNKGGGYAAFIQSNPTNYDWNYNCYFSSGSRFGKYNEQDYDNLTLWGTAIGGDVNSKKLNPNFKSDTALLPYQRLLNGAGISSAGVLLDIDGEIRNQQAPDVGAQEFMVDFGITRLLSPLNKCAHEGDSLVVVYLRQFGDIPFTDIKIAYQVNKGPIVMDTILGSISNDLEYTFRRPQAMKIEGNYDFKIWLVDNSDDNVRNDTLKVLRMTKPSPKVDFEFEDDCANVPVPFSGGATVTPGKIVSYEWNYGDSTVAYGDSGVHIYPRSGTYVVNLKAYSEEGCYSDTSKEVKVKETPDCDFATDNVCLGNYLPIDNKTSSGGDTAVTRFLWNFGDSSTSTLSDPNHLYTRLGKFTVQLVASASTGCKDTAVKQIEVKPIPSLLTNLASYYQVNAGSVNLAGLPAGGTFFGPGVVGGYFYPSLAGLGQFTISYVFVDPATGCENSSNKLVTVIPPSVPVSINSQPSSIDGCEGTDVRLSVDASGSNLLYQWYKNGAMLKGDTAATLSIKPFAKTDAANYTVRVYNMVDTSNSNTINVNFWAKPKASFRYDSSCVNKPIYFRNLSAVAGSGNVRYAWHLEQLPADSSKDIQHAFQQPGTYQVKLVASPDICPSIADSIVRQVKINGPASNLQYEILKLIRNKPTTLKARDLGISYQWEPTLGLNSMSSRTPTLTPTQEQVYTVQIRDTSGCITVDTQKVLIFAEKEIYVPKGFTPNNDGQNDRLYPILVDIVKLNYFKVYNRWGKLMFHTESAEPGKGWDGVYNGVKQPSDSYTWVSEGLDAEGKTVVKSGTVVLIR